MSLVTEKDIAIGISDYLEKITADIDFVPYWTVTRESKDRDIREYLVASARVLGRKKSWIFSNENGDKVKFSKIGGTGYRKEKYSDGCVYQVWRVELESDNQTIFALFEWNATTFSTVRRSGLTLNLKSGDVW